MYVLCISFALLRQSSTATPYTVVVQLQRELHYKQIM